MFGTQYHPPGSLDCRIDPVAGSGCMLVEVRTREVAELAKVNAQTHCISPQAGPDTCGRPRDQRECPTLHELDDDVRRYGDDDN